MPNSTLREAVNKVLRMKRLLTIDSDDVFNDPTRRSSDQDALMVFFDMANRLALERMNTRWLNREFPLPLTQGQAVYDLDAGISSESLAYHSFVNTSVGGSAGAIRGWNGGYDAFRNAFPDLTLITEAVPRIWVLLPIDASAGEATHKVRFYPTPDASYQVIYRAKLNVVPLENAGDILQFPREYEHTLFFYAKALLESEMGSGGDDLTYELASKAVEAVKAWSKGPMETRPIQRVAINFRNGKANRGRFDFDGRAGWFR